jgi:hypothetical protein
MDQYYEQEMKSITFLWLDHAVINTSSRDISSRFTNLINSKSDIVVTLKIILSYHHGYKILIFLNNLKIQIDGKIQDAKLGHKFMINAMTLVDLDTFCPPSKMTLSDNPAILLKGL